MKKKRICFITTGDIKNIATAKRALGMANPLVELGWDVSILIEDTEENHHRVSMECCDKVKVCFFPHGSAMKEIKAKNKLVKEIDPDYLYICAFVTRNIVGIGHRCKKLVEHSELQSGIPDMKGIKKIIAYANEFGSIVYSDALINASRHLQNIFTSRCKKMLLSSRINFYHPYAYSSSVIKVKTIDRNMTKYAGFYGRKILVFLGTITRNYGAFTLIEAVEKVKNSHPEVLLLMLGRGRHYEEACNYVKGMKLDDYVKLPGFVEEEEIPEYFSIADYFVSPMNDTVQDWARCPSKLYMYLPYKKPVITCKIGEPYEVLGKEGIYYKPSDSDSLAEQIIGLLESGKKELVINPNMHSWETRTKEFDTWIKKTLEK